MSIQTTQTMTEEVAIERITRIVCLALQKNYKAITIESFDPNYKIEDCIKEIIELDISCIQNWTTEMLEDVIDRPFFRLSMFDNYCII